MSSHGRRRIVAKMGKQPADYTITYYDATQVIFDAIARVAKSGKPVNRANVRDAIATTNLKTLQGDISFDANGDMKSKVVSIFQVQYDSKSPDRRRRASVQVCRRGARSVRSSA